jgi:hypothetical protein
MNTLLTGLENCPLHRRTPFGIRDVSQTQFSIARYSMGCTFNGDRYVYLPPTDELIRADVLKWQKKAEKKARLNRAAPLASERDRLLVEPADESAS